ncbi:hypothetical protein TNCV_1652031 [Trichonephila clavipes]|nr:hypothetical protein TNCV_1652031 [Trichonephila clavipes]
MGDIKKAHSSSALAHTVKRPSERLTRPATKCKLNRLRLEDNLRSDPSFLPFWHALYLKGGHFANPVWVNR